MPTDQQCLQIAAVVKTLRKAHGHRMLVEDGKRRRQSLEDSYTQTLAPTLEAAFPAVSPLVRGTIGLMVYLGPSEAAFPPGPVRDECIDLAYEYTVGLPDAEQAKRLVQVVLAYGC